MMEIKKNIYTSKLIKKKNQLILGLTLIEILIGIVISSIMMGALYTSYNVVNNSYSQVSDIANVSTNGKNLMQMIVKDIRLAGFKSFGDSIAATNEHLPIAITKTTNFGNECDKIDIVYGGKDFNASRTPNIVYERYKITYECKKSEILDRSQDPVNNVFPYMKTFAVYKTKVKWNSVSNSWNDPTTDGDDETYSPQLVVNYIDDMIFKPVNSSGLAIDPAPSSTSNISKAYDIKTVDVALIIRSSKNFYKGSKLREIVSLSDSTRNIKKNDKILRETILATVHTRNIGLN
jgi:hypothetical protein